MADEYKAQKELIDELETQVLVLERDCKKLDLEKIRVEKELIH